MWNKVEGYLKATVRKGYHILLSSTLLNFLPNLLKATKMLRIDSADVNLLEVH